MADMVKSATYLPIHTTEKMERATSNPAENGASNHKMSSIPTVHWSLSKTAAAGISKRLGALF